MKLKIYCLSLLLSLFSLSSFAQEDFITVAGFVLDNASKSGVSAQILIKNAESFKIVSIIPTDVATGSFTLKLKRQPYYFVIESRGYKLYNELIDLTNVSDQRIQKDLLLIPSELNVPEAKPKETRQPDKVISSRQATEGDDSDQVYTKSTKSSNKDDLLKDYEAKKKAQQSKTTRPPGTGKRYDQMVLDDSIHVEVVNAENEKASEREVKTKLSVPRKIEGQKESTAVKKTENAQNVGSIDDGKESSFTFSLKQGCQFIDVNTTYDEGEVNILSNEGKYEKVLEFLLQNQELNVEIRGFADDGLVNDYQKEIAIRRAKNVEKYFNESGIEANRINAIAFPTPEIELFIRTKRLWRKNHLIEFRLLGDSIQEYDFKMKNSADYEIAYGISLPEDEVVKDEELAISNPSSMDDAAFEASIADDPEESTNNNVEETAEGQDSNEQQPEEQGEDQAIVESQETQEEVATQIVEETSNKEEEGASELTEYDRIVSGEETVTEESPEIETQLITDEEAYQEEDVMRNKDQGGEDEIILDLPGFEPELEEQVAENTTSEFTSEAPSNDEDTEELLVETTSEETVTEEETETEEERLMRVRGQGGDDEVILDLPGFEPKVAEVPKETPKVVEQAVVEAKVEEKPIEEEIDLSSLVEEKDSKEQEEAKEEEMNFNEDDFGPEKKEIDGDKILSAYEKLLAETDEINSKVVFFEKKKKGIDDKYRKAMDSIAHYLDAHPKVKISIIGYGSKKDGKSNVMLLSKQRAQEAMNYFVDKQIDKKRIKIKGAGLFNKRGEKMDPNLEQRVTFEIIPVKINSGKKKAPVSASRGAPPKLKSRGTGVSPKGIKAVTNYDDVDEYESLRTKEVETAKSGEYKTKPKGYPKLKTDDDYYDFLVNRQSADQVRGLSYRIQVGAYRLPLDKTAKLFKLVKDAELVERGDGWYRYFTGNFDNITDAEKVMDKIRKKKLNDAFVAAFYKGKKIPMRKATEMILRQLEER